MAQPIYKTIAATGLFDTWLDDQQSPFNLSYAVEVPAGVTTSFTVLFSLDNPNDAAWTPLFFADPSNGTAKTATVFGNYNTATSPGVIRGLRVNVASLTGGVALLRLVVLQGSTAR